MCANLRTGDGPKTKFRNGDGLKTMYVHLRIGDGQKTMYVHGGDETMH